MPSLASAARPAPAGAQRIGAIWGKKKPSPGKGSFRVIPGEGWLPAPGWKALLPLAGGSAPRHLERRWRRRRILLGTMQVLGGGLSSSRVHQPLRGGGSKKKERRGKQLNPCPKELLDGFRSVAARQRRAAPGFRAHAAGHSPAGTYRLPPSPPAPCRERGTGIKPASWLPAQQRFFEWR